MTIIYNTNFTHNPNAYLTIAVEDAAKQVFGVENVILADNRSLLPIAASGAHEALICIDGQRLNMDLLRRVRPALQTMVLWLFEDPFMTDYNIRHADIFDIIYTNDPACVSAYGSKGKYLPLAGSPLLHYRSIKNDLDLDYDIFFAGTMWPNRTRTLRKIINSFPKARLKLVCPTNLYLPPLSPDIARLAIQWPISHESFIDFANASRVTVTMFRDYASHGDVGQATAPGPRLYELGLSGTAQVVEAGDKMDRRYFDEVAGVGVASNATQLISGINELLLNPDLRNARAQQAQKQVMIAQLYINRLKQISDDISSRVGAQSIRLPPVASERKLRVLMCTHSTIHNNEWGGVEVYQQTLSSMFEREIDVFFWLRRNGQCSLTDSMGAVLECFDMPDVGWLDSLTDAPEEMAFSNVVGHYGFDVVHFQHLGHHTASLPIIAKAAGVGTILSAHDFFLVCARYNLLNHEQVFCDIGNKTISACDICLRVSENMPAGAQQTRRAFVAEMVRSIDVFLFGTDYSRSLVTKIYPEIANRKCAVLGIPMPSGAIIDASQLHTEGGAAPLVVAIVGNFLRSKGADVIMSLIQEANPNLFHFHILGAAEAQYAEILGKWNKPNVVYHGRYSPSDLSSIGGADVALHMSIWPETYCISLSEVWQRGLIPIVSDIGALHDRVIHGVNGFKVAVGNASAVMDRLELLRANPALRRAIRANIGPHLWTDYQEYADSLLKIYQDVAPNRLLGAVGLRLDVGQLHLLPHDTWRSLAPPRHIFDPSRRSPIQLELPVDIQNWTHIQGSELYIDSICDMSPSLLERHPFLSTPDLGVRGWTFVPGVSIAGQVHVALVGDGEEPVIFFPANRDVRDDILNAFPSAPRRSGFSGRVALHGKWCEGRYAVAIINSFEGFASFCLTSFEVQIADGRVINAHLETPSNDKIIRAFYKVSSQTGADYETLIAGVPVKDRMWHMGQALQYYIDEVSSKDGNLPYEVDLPTRYFKIRGWAFLPGLKLAGTMYVGLAGVVHARCALVPCLREIRDDVKTLYSDAMLCSGFLGGFEIALDWPDGDSVVVMANVVDGTAYGQISSFIVTIVSGQIVSVSTGNLSNRAFAHVQARLQGQSGEPPAVDANPNVTFIPDTTAGKSRQKAPRRVPGASDAAKRRGVAKVVG